MKQKLVVVSNHKDPYLNHAVEEILFKAYSGYEQILFLWVNEKSVVFGRNQNPWREIDIDTANQNNIKLIRRISGGGTVYHDSGNLNYSFIDHVNSYNEIEHFDWIKEALNSLGIKLELSKRKDLLCEGKKVSGSAFYLKGNRRIHHGTLLVDADTKSISNLLKAKDINYSNLFLESKGITSVSSEVINLKTISPEISVAKVINAIIDTYYRSNAYDVEVVNIDEIISTQEELIEKSIERFKSWQWIFGQTPSFSFKLESGETVSIVKGAITHVTQFNIPQLQGVRWENLRR